MDLLSMADVERKTSVPRSWIAYQMQLGRIPEPARLRGRRCFSPEQAEEIQARYREHLNRKEERKKKKDQHHAR